MSVLVDAAPMQVEMQINYDRGIEVLENELRTRIECGQLQPAECPVHHEIRDGLYVRTIRMPAGALVVGAEHSQACLNVFHFGHMQVMINGKITEIREPRMFFSEPGVRKVALIFDDVEFSNIHPNPDNCSDIDELERRYTVKNEQTKNTPEVIL